MKISTQDHQNPAPGRKGVLFVISAPSGAGKTSLCREVIDRFPELRHSVSFTTRSRREGEVDGVDYYFVGQSDFEKMIAENRLAEWAEVHGNLYGTSLQTLQDSSRQGIDLLLDIDCQGAAQLKQNYDDGVFTFILPPSFDELERRLRGRETDSDEVIEQRLRNALQELPEARWYDYLVINDKFELAVQQLSAVIQAERCRTDRIYPYLPKTFSVPRS